MAKIKEIMRLQGQKTVMDEKLLAASSTRYYPLYTRHYPTGFTLLEVLVVLLIIGIIVSVAGLSFSTGGPESRLREEAQRLHALLELASQEAILQQREFGLRLEEHAYQFYLLGNEQWLPMTEDNVLRSRNLPKDIATELQVEGYAANDETPEDIPHIVLFSSGEITPFTLHLSLPFATDEHHILTGLPNGELQYDMEIH